MRLKTWLGLILGLALCGPASGAIPQQLGLNACPITDATEIFADLVAHSRGFSLPSSPYGGYGPVDAAGWPTGDCVVLGRSGTVPTIAGTYQFRFVGQAVVGSRDTNATITQSYNVATNTTTGTYVIPPTSPATLVMLSLTNTRRLPTDTTATGVTGLKWMRPIAPGSATPHDFTERWCRRFLAAFSPFQMIRSLDLVDANGFDNSVMVDWSKRHLPSDPIQTSRVMIVVGIAPELLVDLANTLNQNLWICLPHTGTDDYFTKYAQTVRYGSDGVNPYTGPPGSTGSNPQPATGPVWPGLRGLSVWEFSNEIAFTSQFSQFGYALNAGQTLANSNPSVIAYDGQTNIYYLQYRWIGLQVLRMRNLLAAVLDDANFNTTWATILGNQVDGGPVLTEALGAISHNDTRPLSQIVGLSGAGWYRHYYIQDMTVTPDQAFGDGYERDMTARLSERSVLQPLGIPSSGYEGNLQCSVNDNLFPLSTAMDQDVRRYNDFLRAMLAQFNAGVRVLCVFDYQTGPWGIAPNGDTSSQRYKAARDVALALKAGTALPVPPTETITAPSLATGAPVLADRDFETATLPTVGTSDYVYRPAGTGWTYVGGAGVTGLGSAFTVINLPTPSGNQCGFLQDIGTISQSVSGWTAGSYKLSMVACLRVSTTVFPSQAVNVQVDGTTVGTITPTSVYWAVYTTPAFTVTAGTHTVSLVGTNTNTDHTAFVDAVTIQPSGIMPPPMNPSSIGDAFRRYLRQLRRAG